MAGLGAFDGRTTNSLTYRGEQLPSPAGAPGAVGDRAPAGVVTARRGGPQSLLDIPDPQPRDFDTAYRSQFDRPNAVRMLSKAEAVRLLRELRARKLRRESATTTETTDVDATNNGSSTNVSSPGRGILKTGRNNSNNNSNSKKKKGSKRAGGGPAMTRAVRAY